MMTVLKVALLSTIIVTLGACGGTPACQKPQPYQTSRVGKHVEAPEGLDSLEADRELTIPEPSPRPPRPADSPCLEDPPTLATEEEGE
jgi:uncharacterized lipoprotein